MANKRKAKTNLKDVSIKHQIFLLRQAGSTSKQLQAFVNKLKKEAIKVLDKKDITTLSKARYLKIHQSLNDISAALIADMKSGVKDSLSSLAEYEADFTKRVTDKVLNPDVVSFETSIPSTKQLISAASTSIIDKRLGGFDKNAKLTIGNGLEKFGAKKAGKLVAAIREGAALGKTTPEIVKDIQGLFTDRQNRNQITALARTVTNHVASSARQAFYEENADIVTGYQVVATLDDRTSEECAALDGQYFSADEFVPPPYHYGCRSTFIAVIDPKLKIQAPSGGRPSKGEDGTETVDSRTTYNSWLKTQSAAFQDEILGATKGEMFRNGYSMKDFVDENYKPYSVAELKAMDDKYN